MRHYIRTRFGEYIACTAVCCGICFPVYAGFVLTDPFSGIAPLGVLILAAITALLYLCAYNRTAAVFGICAGVALAAAAVIFIQMTDPLGSEEENSVFIFLLVGVIIALIVFLLSRSRAGIIVTAILGNLITAGSYFLAFPVHLWSYLVFIAGTGVLFLMRVYAHAAKNVMAGSIRFGRYFLQSILISLAALGVASGLFFAVIKPLDLPVRDLELISMLRNMDILEVFGIAEEREVYDPELAGGQVVVDTDYGNDEGDEDSPENNQDDHEDTESAFTKWIQGGIRSLRGVTYRLRERSYWWMLDLIPLVVAVIFAVRYARKKLWHRKVQSLSHEAAVLNYYSFVNKRLEIAGYAKPAEYTVDEYARMMEHTMEPFAEGDSTYAALSSLYSRVYYGKGKVTDEEYTLVESFYARFHRCLKDEMGTGKYLLHIFRI